MTKRTRARCEYCNRVLPAPADTGRKMHYCPDRSCKQRAYEARKNAGTQATTQKTQLAQTEKLEELRQTIAAANFQWQSYVRKAERREMVEISAWTLFDDVRDYIMPALAACEALLNEPQTKKAAAKTSRKRASGSKPVKRSAKKTQKPRSKAAPAKKSRASRPKKRTTKTARR